MRMLGRRTFLRGLTTAGTAMVGLPLLDVMLDRHGTALASGEPLPLRLGTFFWGNGIVPVDSAGNKNWVPAATGAGWAPTPNLQPIHDMGVVNDVTVISGMRHEVAVGCHNPGRSLMLSGSWNGMAFDGASGTSSATLPSVDQLVATHYGSSTTFPSIEIAISRAGIGAIDDTFSCSWRDGNLLPAETSPRALFDRLFLGFTPDDSVRMALISVLDAVLDDATALQSRLGTQDRQRMEAHLEALRALEVRVEAEPPDCAIPGVPVDPAPEQLMARTQLFADLLAVAMVCDLTRAFSIRFTQSVGDTVFSEIGAAEGHHTLSHSNFTMHANSVSHTVACFAALVKRFGEQMEGDGRLLDRCALMAVTDLCDGSTHTVEDLPILVAGQAGGALVTGIHHREMTTTRASIVPYTLLRAVGVPAASFGSDMGEVTQTLTGIEAV